MHELRM